MLWRGARLLLGLLILVIAVSAASAETSWKLRRNDHTVASIPVREGRRSARVSIGVMARELRCKVKSKRDTLTISLGGKKLQIINRASAAWLGYEIFSMPSPALLDDGRWWVDSRSAISMMTRLLNAGGESVSLSWFGGDAGSSSVRKVERAVAISDREEKDVAVSRKKPISPALSSVSGLAVLKRVRWGRYDDKIRVVLDLSDGKKAEATLSGEKLRVAVAPFRTAEVEGLTSPWPDEVSIGTVNYGNRSVVTIVHRSGRIKHFALDVPSREVVDLYLGEDATFSAPERPLVSSEPVEVEAPASKRGKLRVVIDPGHGGKDPGAMANGIREKDLNQQIGRRLAAHLRKMGLDARLTRNSDHYLKLSERTGLANKWEADAFISIHANALPAGRHARGIEIYLMALPTDRDAMRLAKIENAELCADNGKSSNSDKKTEMLLSILGDMQQNAKISESTRFAEALFNQGRRKGLPMRRVAQAPFFVLRGAAMPAVLVETGFLTERSEARKLATASYQEALARTLAEGISSYFGK